MLWRCRKTSAFKRLTFFNYTKNRFKTCLYCEYRRNIFYQKNLPKAQQDDFRIRFKTILEKSLN